jgi:hypothetical protein
MEKIMNKKKPSASKIREMLEKFKRGEPIEPIGPCRTIWTKPLPDDVRSHIDMSMTEHFTELNEQVEDMISPKNWEPPEIRNSLGLFNWIDRALKLADGNPALEARMLRSVFGLMCEQLDDKTSCRIAQAIWDRPNH